MSINVLINNCKICLECDISKIYWKMGTKALPPSQQSPKDVIVEYLPQMQEIITEEDLICETCLQLLQITQTFLNNCMILLKRQSDLIEQEPKDIIDIVDTNLECNEDDFMETIKIEDMEEKVDGNPTVLDHNYSIRTLDNLLLDFDDFRTEIVKIEEENGGDVTEQINNIKQVNDNNVDKIKGHVHSTEKISCYIDASGEICNIEQANSDIDVSREIPIIKQANNNKVDKIKASIQSKKEKKVSDDDVLEQIFKIKQAMENEVNKIKVPVNETEKASCDVDVSEQISDIKEVDDDNESVLPVHKKRKITTPSIISCKTYKELFLNKSDLDKHMFKKFKFFCRDCDLMFDIAEDFKEHIKVHSEHICDTCGKIFNTKNLLDSHIKTHSQTPSHICEFCGKAFTSSTALTCHLRIHGQGVPKYQCHVCGKKFFVGVKLRIHVQTHSNEKKCICEWCGKHYKSGATLKSHINATHLQIKKFKCNVCQKMFSRRTFLKNHLKVHERMKGGERGPKVKVPYVGKKPTDCKICGKVCSNFRSLQIHKKTHGKRRVPCPDCGLRFKNNFILWCHQKTHDKETNRCEVCYKKFLPEEEEELSRHKASHVNERLKYKCEHCDKSFSKLFLYENHVHLAHSAEVEEEENGGSLNENVS